MEAPAQEQSVEEIQYADFWTVDETHKYYLDHGRQWFEFRVMDEGAKSEFQKLTNSDLVVGRNNEARVKVDPVKERHTLITKSVIGWKLYKSNQEVGFSRQMLEKWLTSAPPKVVEDLEREIRKANPWMQADMSVEEIDKEIDRLYDLRKQVAEQQEGEGTSANK